MAVRGIGNPFFERRLRMGVERSGHFQQSIERGIIDRAAKRTIGEVPDDLAGISPAAFGIGRRGSVEEHPPEFGRIFA